MPVIYRTKDIISKIRPRIKLDVYQTPHRLIYKTLDWLFLRYPITPIQFGNILDPGAGAGHYGEILNETLPEAHITGVEQRRVSPNSEYDYWFQSDYLKWQPGKSGVFQLIIGNPPFGLAGEFINHSREFLSQNGKMCFLLTSNFSHGQTRGRGLYADYKPEWIVSLMQRPNFVGPKKENLGNANSDTYILGVWGRESAKVTMHDWLDWGK